MILSEKTLEIFMEHYICDGDPMLGPASIDLTIGMEFMQLNYTSVINLDEEIKYSKIVTDRFILEPNGFALATTQEKISIPNGFAGLVVGRSSIARAGLQVECSGFIGPGFNGNLTLDLYNQNKAHSIKIPVGKRLCQLILFKCDKDSVNPYNGKYQNQTGVTGSKSEKDNLTFK